MKPIEALTGLLGISVVAGINLYATVLTVGLGLRYGFISGLPPEMQVLAHPAVLGVAAALYLAEFVADKIPFVTPIWDLAHTVIRPLGAAALAVGATADMSPLGQVMAAMLGGSVALSTHATKMGVRLVAHGAPDPVSHSAISIAEDFGVVGLLLLAYQYPWIALPLLVAVLVAVAWCLPFVVRILRFLLAGLFGRLTGWSGTAPLDDKPPWAPSGPAVRVFTRRFARSPRLQEGYLSTDKFHYRRWRRTRIVELPVEWPSKARIRNGVLFDVVEGSAPSGRGMISFYLTKDWSGLWPSLQTQNEKAEKCT